MQLTGTPRLALLAPRLMGVVSWPLRQRNPRLLRNGAQYAGVGQGPKAVQCLSYVFVCETCTDAFEN